MRADHFVTIQMNVAMELIHAQKIRLALTLMDHTTVDAALDTPVKVV